jgi:hypothetical protein
MGAAARFILGPETVAQRGRRAQLRAACSPNICMDRLAESESQGRTHGRWERRIVRWILSVS